MVKNVLTFRNLILFISLISIASCKKGDTTPTKSRISSIDYQVQAGTTLKTNNYSLNYDDKGRLTYITQTNPDTNTQATERFTRAFVYHQNSVVATTEITGDYSRHANFNGQVYTQYDSIQVGGDSLASGIYHERHFPYNESFATQYSGQSYQYIKNEMQESNTSGMFSLLQYTLGDTHYTWDNGDLVTTASSVDGAMVYYQYDNSHKYTVGDYNQLKTFMLTGMNFYPTQHLVNGITDYKGNSTTITYDFDTKGNIIQVVASSNLQTETFTLHYSFY